MVPTLISFFMKLVRYPENNKPLLCPLASMILKKRSPALGFKSRPFVLALS